MTLDRRRFLRGVGMAGGGLLLLGPLAACGDDDADATSAGGTYTGDLAVSHLTAVVGSAPIHIAMGRGYFEEEGLDLSPVSFPGGSDTIRGIRSDMNMGEPATLATIVAYSKGERDLRFVGGCFNGTQVLFLVPSDSPIEAVTDLAGGKIGVSSPTSITTYFASLVAGQEGMTVGDDVELVNVGGPPDAWTAVSEGIVDAAWSSPPLSATLIEGGDARVLFHTKDYAPEWSDQMLVATQRFIDDEPEVVQGFVTAIGRACDLIRDDTEAAAMVYADALDITPEAAQAALEDPGLESWSTDFDRPGIEANLRAAEETDQLDDDVDLDELIVTDFVP